MHTTLYTADWVLPVTSAPLADGAVLVNECGVIERVAPADTFASYDGARTDLGPAILLPGLINTHAHPELAGMRGLLEDIPFHEWIPTLRRAKLGAADTPSHFEAAARWTCLEAIAAGITTLAATEDSGASLAALREMGMRGVVFREVFGPAAARAAGALHELRARVDAMRALATDLVHVGISPHAPYTVSDDLFRLAAAYAVTESLPVAVHIAESEAEHQLVTDGAGPFAAGLRTRGITTPARASSPIALLRHTGVLAARPLLIHCIRLSADDIVCMSDHGVAVAHCPIANARLGHGIAPIVELDEAGITIGLGSDSVASNNRIDMLEEARTAQLMQRARLRSSAALAPERLLRMATIDGARALQLDARVGSLETGKDADICAVRITAPHTRPVHDPVATLFHSARGSDVMLTIVRGAILYRAGDEHPATPHLRTQLEDGARALRAARDATS